MNKLERVYAALEGQPVDQIPLGLWRQFHQRAQTPASLASATLAFYNQYNYDLIRVTPSLYYAIEDWGAQITPAKDSVTPPRLKKPVITQPKDWRNLSTLNVEEGKYREALEAVRLINRQLEGEAVPLLMTVLSPLTIAYQLAGKALVQHIESHATDVHIGLATIAETTCRFAEAAIEAGANGLFLVSEMASGDLLSEEQYQSFVITYDLFALERVTPRPAPLVLHMAGDNLYFELVNQYPVHALSWQTNTSAPSLAEVQRITGKTTIGGISLENGHGDVATQMHEAMIQTHGRQLILAPTSEISAETPEATLKAITAVDRSVSSPPDIG